MAENKDPFSFIADDHTAIRPIPGGQIQDIPQNTQVLHVSGDEQAQKLKRLGKLNPLESSASALLGLVAQLYNRPSHPSPQQLKQQLSSEVHHFQNAAEQLGIKRDVIKQASYALCTTIDEAIYNTPWGQQFGWSQKGLLNEFHQSITGGEGFFHQLKAAGDDPADNLYLLEVMYLCLSFGFQGRYGLVNNGQATLGQIKIWLGQLIREQRGSNDKELSPHWKGVKVAQATQVRAIPLWVYYAIAGGILTAVFLSLLSLLSVQASPIKQDIDQIAFQGSPEPVERAAVPPVNFLRLLEGLLTPEIQAELVTLHQREGRPVVELRGDTGKGLFASGRDALRDGERENVVNRVAEALATEQFRPFSFTVTGYTDNIPVRNKINFQDNRELSKARAETVQNMMKARHPGLRLSVKAKGELDPIVDNATPKGRARNRRVEIIMD